MVRISFKITNRYYENFSWFLILKVIMLNFIFFATRKMQPRFWIFTYFGLNNPCFVTGIIYIVLFHFCWITQFSALKCYFCLVINLFVLFCLVVEKISDFRAEIWSINCNFVERLIKVFVSLQGIVFNFVFINLVADRISIWFRWL